MALARYRYAMTDATQFNCPTCESQYRVVRVEAPPTHDNQLLCLVVAARFVIGKAISRLSTSA